MAPRMVYLSMIYLLLEHNLSKRVRRFDLSTTGLDHVLVSREGGHIHQTESPYHEQRSGIPSACHLQSNHPAEI